MSDFNNQKNIDSTPNYSPLTNDYDNPSYNITQDPHIIQANIISEENSLNKNSGEYTIYKTPYGCVHIFLFIIFIIFSIISLFIPILGFLKFNDGIMKYISILFPLLFLIMGFCITSVYYIIYDSSQKRIILKRAKIFKCITLNQIIQINDIQKVTLDKYADDSNNRFIGLILF